MIVDRFAYDKVQREACSFMGLLVLQIPQYRTVPRLCRYRQLYKNVQTPLMDEDLS